MPLYSVHSVSVVSGVSSQSVSCGCQYLSHPVFVQLVQGRDRGHHSIPAVSVVDASASPVSLSVISGGCPLLWA